MLLEKIHSPEDLKRLLPEERKTLAEELRHFLVRSLSKTGGHLGSNLGVVELTIALHTVFSSPKDKIIWDVGHQAYVHKILTGRADRFGELRQENGLSGFPKGAESEHDHFDTGHASTSISAAYGMAKGRDLQHQDHEVIAVIGDGSMTGGMAYEALNNAGKGESKIIVVLNDNDMAISRNVGRLSNNLSRMRTRRIYLRTKADVKKSLLKAPFGGRRLYRHLHSFKRRIKYFLLNGVFFEEMGFVYLGPFDGHNTEDLCRAFMQAKSLDESVIVHVKTVKGKGYLPAEQDPEKFHGIGPFDQETGCCEQGEPTWSDVFGETLTDLAGKNPKIAAVTAAMPDGTGLSRFSAYYPERFFDVGIAEEHAVTFAAGLAKAGMHPVVAIYSTFLQRGYDQILHDVCMTGQPVVLAVDRSGIVGKDGETHQGIFDLVYLSHIPGLTVMSPASGWELKQMLSLALTMNGPCAIRYPRGAVVEEPSCEVPVRPGRGVILHSGEKVAVLALGDMVAPAMEAMRRLEKDGISITVANARFAAPLDLELIEELAGTHQAIITVEDHIEGGGFGMQVTAALHTGAFESPCRIRRLAVADQFVPQGTRSSLLQRFGLCPEGIEKAVRELLA